MYIARFSSGKADVLSAAFKWPTPNGAVMPAVWRRALLAQARVDLALRVVVEPGSSQVVLLLSGNLEAEAELRDCCEMLLRAQKPSGLVVPSVASEYDTCVGPVPAWQMRVNHDGYQHDGNPLACDFRLYTMLASRLNTESLIYQIHLRAHRPDAEVERRVRKYMAWLDLEKPFSEPVRAMQRTLAQRLHLRGAMAYEYLAVQNQAFFEHLLERIRVHFKETTGRIGFPDPPVETGDFTDWLVTGCHPDRHAETAPSLLCQAASLFSEEELGLLLCTQLALPLNAGPGHSSKCSQPDVFISYASGDSALAAATCRHLEENDFVCWIAPRDIDRDILPYTEAIERSLSQVRAVVVLLSETANLSVHIPRELDLALERKLAIVPVRLQEVLPAGQLNYLLRTCQWLNAYGRNFDDSMNELLTRLRKLLK